MKEWNGIAKCKMRTCDPRNYTKGGRTVEDRAAIRRVLKCAGAILLDFTVGIVLPTIVFMVTVAVNGWGNPNPLVGLLFFELWALGALACLTAGLCSAIAIWYGKSWRWRVLPCLTSFSLLPGALLSLSTSQNARRIPVGWGFGLILFGIAGWLVWYAFRSRGTASSSEKA